MATKETKTEKIMRLINEPIHAGEYEAKKYLRSRGWEVWDESNNPLFWKKDIDLLLGDDEDNPDTSIEVKWDRRMNQTGNMFIEFKNTSSQKGLGWFNFCEAEFVWYGDAAINTFYVFRFKDLKNYINENLATLKTKSTFTNNYYQTGESVGYLVPLLDFVNNVETQIINVN